MPDLTSILERVRAASGPDRELDRDIVLAMCPDIGPYNPPCIGDEPIFWHEPYYKQPAPVYFTEITRPAAGFSKGYPIAADLLSRIDKEIGDG